VLQSLGHSNKWETQQRIVEANNKWRIQQGIVIEEDTQLRAQRWLMHVSPHYRQGGQGTDHLRVFLGLHSKPLTTCVHTEDRTFPLVASACSRLAKSAEAAGFQDMLQLLKAKPRNLYHTPYCILCQ